MNKPRKRLQTSVELKLPFRRKYFLRFATGLILLVWTSLYLPNLGTTPRWYGDETITLSCGQDLVHGVFANRATWNTYMNPQFCYQPGYVFLVGLASTVSHQDIAWPRFLNALCALGIALVAFRVLGRRFGLLTTLSIGLLFLTYEQSVIHFRWVYAHNAVALGLFICFCFQTIPIRKYRSWGAGIGLAIAAASHPLAVQGGLAALLNRWNQPRTWLPLFFPPLAVGLLSLGPIFLWKPDWLIHDIFELKEFYGSFTQDLGAGLQWPTNFWNFFTHDWFHILALASSLFCLFSRFRPIALASLLIAGLLTRNRQNLPVFYYQAVVILPLLAAGSGYALTRLSRILPWKKHLTRWLIFLLPTALLFSALPKVWGSRLESRNDPWVVKSISDIQKTAIWLNQHSKPEDLVICHWNIGWLLRSQNADPLMCVGWNGLPTFTYENRISRERFRYDADLTRAKYIVISDIDRIWTLGQPNVGQLFNEQNLLLWVPIYQNSSCLVLTHKNRL